MKNIVLILMPFFLILSCQKDDDIELSFETDAGKDVLNIDEFKVSLDAKELSAKEEGVWTIISGLIDNKVYFIDKNNPKTIFHGLPGEEYKLVWTSTNLGKKATDTISISFSPLKTEIINVSPEFYKTRLNIQAKIYDKGKWTIQGGNYDHIWNQNFGGFSIPDEESPNIRFYGLENKNYILTWTTWYGSKSASVSMNFTSSNFHQDEALEDLNILYRPWMYKKNINNDVVEVNMSGDNHGFKFRSLEKYPALQALTHLKKLDLSGDGFDDFPEVIATKYLDLEVLNFAHNAITSLPENFGNLNKLDTLIIYNNQENKILPSIPESFGKLKNIRYLNLSGMGISNIPESFSNLTNLNYLDLEGNVINKLPKNFGNLKRLETLRGPGLLTALPSSFSNLTNLKFCFFSINTNLPTSLPDDFGKLKNLETLWLFGKYEHLPMSFASLINLKDLEITGGSILKELPVNFGNLINLKRIRIAGEFTTLPESFTKLSNLTDLRIHGNLKYLPNDFGKLSKLYYLQLDQLNLQELPKSFGDLEGLYHFSAYGNKITTIPDSFGNLKKIYELNLSYNSISIFPNNLSNLSNTLFDFQIRGNNYSENELNHLKKMLPSTRIYSN
jgi:Leucine-rich repeat (LRR) protein